MIKKLICGLLVGVVAVVAASCCAADNTVETRPPESVKIDEKTKIEVYPTYVTQYKWVNEKTGDTINFNNSGTFSGKVDGEAYSGTFDITLDKKVVGRINMNVTLDNAEKSVKWHMDFEDTSAAMKLTTDKDKSESYVAEWTLREQDNNE